jgi:hypothetical protein
MPKPRARKMVPTKGARGVRPGSGLLSQFHCESIIYSFTLPADTFNQKAFSRRTGLKVGDRWNTGIYPTDPSAGYHVHFKGRLGKDEVNITVEYWDGSFTAPQEGMPGAESIMDWIGSLVREPTSRAHVFASFEKPLKYWRSLFNLPFKVTMGGQEVTIDGVTLELPKNPSRAYHALVATSGKTLDASVNFSRTVEFATFKINEEIPTLNEAVKIFAEETVAS